MENHWFKKLKERYKNENLIFEQHKKYPYMRVYYKTPIYKLLLADVPMNLSPYNYREKKQALALSDYNFYIQLEEKNKVEEAMDYETIVKGYYAHIVKIDRRIYLLKNNQEFLSTALQNSKSIVN